MRKLLLLIVVLLSHAILVEGKTPFWIDDVPWDDGKALQIKWNVSDGFVSHSRSGIAESGPNAGL